MLHAGEVEGPVGGQATVADGGTEFQAMPFPAAPDCLQWPDSAVERAPSTTRAWTAITNKREIDMTKQQSGSDEQRSEGGHKVSREEIDGLPRRETRPANTPDRERRF
ncbi:hypothetical protein GCM10023195_51030 [Actinoallomurus liliacearum]|uniref:Uncharacterized protein n=1 Tax=Actinoallomurus liliacearum TaxID=1080073 RepID=A0ABP8TMV1_9ACTN